MPTYVYECSNCGHGFETTQSIKDEPLTKCEMCKEDGLRRVPQLAVGGFRIYGKGVHKPTSRMN